MSDERLGRWLAFWFGMATLAASVIVASVAGCWQGAAIPVSYVASAFAAKLIRG